MTTYILRVLSLIILAIGAIGTAHGHFPHPLPIAAAAASSSPTAYLLLLNAYIDVHAIPAGTLLSFSTNATSNDVKTESNTQLVVSVKTLDIHRARSVDEHTTQSIHHQAVLHDFLRVVPATASDQTQLRRLMGNSAASESSLCYEGGTDSELNFCIRRVLKDAVGVKRMMDRSVLPQPSSEEAHTSATTDEAAKEQSEEPHWNASSDAKHSGRRRLLLADNSNEAPLHHHLTIFPDLYRGVIDAMGTVDVVERMQLEDKVWPGRPLAERGEGRHQKEFVERLQNHGTLSHAAWDGKMRGASSSQHDGKWKRAQSALARLLSRRKKYSLAASDVLDWVSSSAGEGVRVGLFDSGMSMRHEGFNGQAYEEAVMAMDPPLHHENENSDEDGEDQQHNPSPAGAGTLVKYCRTFTGAADGADGPLRYVENLEGTEGCHDGFGHGTFVAGVVASRGIPLQQQQAAQQRKRNGGRLPPQSVLDKRRAFLRKQRDNGGAADADGDAPIVRRKGARGVHNNGGGNDEDADANDWKQKVLGVVRRRQRGEHVIAAADDDADTAAEGPTRRPPAQCRGIAPMAALHVFKTFTDDQISYTSYFLAALNEALQMGLDVINLSMGGYDYEDHPFVEKALELSAAGVVVVTANGNDGPHWGTTYNPADQLDVVAVGAVNHKEQIAKFSSRGMTTWELPFGVGRPKPDVLAFGDPIAGAAVKGGLCRSLAGTSMASPVVAGVLSLVSSTIMKRVALCEACEGIADDGDGKEASLIDVCNALKMNSSPNSSAPSLSFCHQIRASGGVNVAMLKQVLFATSRPLFPFRSAPVFVKDEKEPKEDASRSTYTMGRLGVSSDLTAYTALEHSIFAQGAGLVDAEAAVKLAASTAFVPHLSAFPSDLLLYAHPTSFALREVTTSSSSAAGDGDGAAAGADPLRFPPREAQRAADECEYMWPLCAQPIFYTGMPLRANLTLLNSVTAVARRRRCHALLRHHGLLSRYVGVSVDCSDRLWPHVGTAAVSFAVLRPFPSGRSAFYNTRKKRAANSSNSHFIYPAEHRRVDFAPTVRAATKRYAPHMEEALAMHGGSRTPPSASASPHHVLMETAEYIIVEGTIEIEYDTAFRPQQNRQQQQPLTDDGTVLRTSVPFRIKVLKHTPPRPRRLLWDVSHSIQFPFAYIPRDSIGKRGANRNGGASFDGLNDAAMSADFLDWNGDHPYANYAATLLHLTRSKGYYVDLLGSPRGLLETFPKEGGPNADEYPNHVVALRQPRSKAGALLLLKRMAKLFGHNDVAASAGGVPSAQSAITDLHIAGSSDSAVLEGSFACDLSSIASRYGAVLLADTEDFFTPREIGRVAELLHHGHIMAGDLSADPSSSRRGSSSSSSLRAVGKGWVDANRLCPYVIRGEDAHVEKEYMDGESYSGDATTIDESSAALPTFGLVVTSEWYNGPLLPRMGGTDDNTGSYWEPIVGGANVPALNELLAPFGVQLSHIVLEGGAEGMARRVVEPIHASPLPQTALRPLLVLGDDALSAADTVFGQHSVMADHSSSSAAAAGVDSHARPFFSSGGTIQLVPASEQCQWCAVTSPGTSRVDSRTVPILGVDAGTSHSNGNGNGRDDRDDAVVGIRNIERRPDGSNPIDEYTKYNNNGGDDERAAAEELKQKLAAAGVGDHGTMLFLKASQHGRLALLTDSSCLDMNHHKHYPTVAMKNNNQMGQKNRDGHDRNGGGEGDAAADPSAALARQAPLQFAAAVHDYQQSFCFGALDALLGFTMRLKEDRSSAGGGAPNKPKVIDLQAPAHAFHGWTTQIADRFEDRGYGAIRRGGEEEVRGGKDRGASGGGDLRTALLASPPTAPSSRADASLRCYACSAGVRNPSLFAPSHPRSTRSVGGDGDAAVAFNLLQMVKSTAVSSGSDVNASSLSSKKAEEEQMWGVVPCPLQPSAVNVKQNTPPTAMCRSIVPFVKEMSTAQPQNNEGGRALSTSHPLSALLPIYFSLQDMAAQLQQRLVAMSGASWTARRRLGLVEPDGDDDWDRHRSHRMDRSVAGRKSNSRRNNRAAFAASEEEGVEFEMNEAGNGGSSSGGSSLDGNAATASNGVAGGSVGRRRLPIVFEEHYEEEENNNAGDAQRKKVEADALAVADIPAAIGGEEDAGVNEVPVAQKKPIADASRARGPTATSDVPKETPPPPTPTPHMSVFTLSLSNPWLPIIAVLYALKWYVKLKLLASARFRAAVYRVLVKVRLLPLIERLGLLGVVRRLGCLPPFNNQPKQQDPTHQLV